MPQGRDHIYFLMDSGNKSYYVSNGLVLSSATPRPLQHTPDGWRNIVINNERNQKYFAVDRSFSAPLDFVKDGAQILKHLYYNRGIEEKVFLAIAKQQLYIDDTHYGYYYTLLYKGELDFSNFKHDGPKVTVNIMEGGMVKYLKNRENTTYEIPVDDIVVKMDGVKLNSSSLFTTIDETHGIQIPVAYEYKWVSLVFINTDGVAINSIQKSTDVSITHRSNSDNDDSGFPDNWFFKATGNLTIRIQFTITVQIANAAYYELYIKNSNGTRTIIGAYTPSSLLTPYFTTQTFICDQDFTLAADETLFLISKVAFTPTLGGNLIFLREAEIKINYASKYKTTYIKALRPLKLLQEIIHRMTEGQYTVESDTLTENEEIVVTSGDAIRGIEGAKIKTSLLQFFQSFNTVLGIGMGMVGSQLRLEKKSYWVDYTDPIDLGEVKNLTVSPATDYIYSALKIGYAEQEYEDVNGRQEFNNTHEYLFPGLRITKTLEMVSPYRADCYGIEFTRINLEGKSTTDDKSDNDVFLLHIKKTPIEENGMTVYELDRSLNAGATGLLENETVFNIYLSPKHCLFRNGPYLRSLFYKQDGRFIKFQTTEKNAALVSDVTENADVMVASLGDGLFAPNLLEADVKMPRNVQAILDQNPLKAFTFTWLGMRFTGIPVKESTRESDRAAQTIQLLMAPDQDLTPLETVNG